LENRGGKRKPDAQLPKKEFVSATINKGSRGGTGERGGSEHLGGWAGDDIIKETERKKKLKKFQHSPNKV